MRITALLFLALAADVFAQEAAVSLRDEAKGKARVISIIADTLTARVWAQKGVVRGLKAEDFVVTRGNDTAQIGEFGEVTTASTADIAFTFILDNSGSMFSAYDSLTSYLDEFVDLIGDGMTANVIAFDNVERKPIYESVRRERMFIALSGFTEDKQEMKDFWHFYDTIRSDFTPLYDATLAGLYAIRDRRNKGDVERHEIVLVVTDGYDNVSQTRLGELEELAEAMRITLYTISYRAESDRKLAWLVSKTGGRHFDASSLQALAESLRELRKQFTASYRIVYTFPLEGAGSDKR